MNLLIEARTAVGVDGVAHRGFVQLQASSVAVVDPYDTVAERDGLTLTPTAVVHRLDAICDDHTDRIVQD